MFVNVTQKSFTPSIKNLYSRTLSAKFRRFILQLGKFSILKSKILPRFFYRFQIFTFRYSSILVGPHKREQEEVSAKLQPGTITHRSLLETGFKLKTRCSLSQVVGVLPMLTQICIPGVLDERGSRVHLGWGRALRDHVFSAKACRRPKSLHLLDFSTKAVSISSR